MTTTPAPRTLGIHFFYVALILGLIIVLLITFEWTSLKGFTDFLSVAATLSSLILGILAIIYGFVSNGSINQSLGSVETASMRMGQVASDLGSIVVSGQSVQLKAEARTEQLHELIVDMQTGLAALGATTEKIAGSVDSISDKINNAQKSAPKEPDSSDSNALNVEAANSVEQPEVRFVRRMSPFGLLTVYAAMRASDANRYVDFMKLVGPGNYDYAWGFLVASSSSGALSLEYPSKKSGMRAVRLKNPSDALVTAITAAWESAPSGKKMARKTLVEKFGPLIESSFVDQVESEE